MLHLGKLIAHAPRYGFELYDYINGHDTMTLFSFLQTPLRHLC